MDQEKMLMYFCLSSKCARVGWAFFGSSVHLACYREGLAAMSDKTPVEFQEERIATLRRGATLSVSAAHGTGRPWCPQGWWVMQ